MTTPLAGKRVLIVEDHFLLAEALADCIADAGAEVVGPCPSVEAALASLDQAGRVDVAILDVMLDRQTSEPVADRLRAMGSPVLLMTGYDDLSMSQRLRGLPRCLKPFERGSLLRKLGELVVPN